MTQNTEPFHASLTIEHTGKAGPGTPRQDPGAGSQGGIPDAGSGIRDPDTKDPGTETPGHETPATRIPEPGPPQPRPATPIHNPNSMTPRTELATQVPRIPTRTTV